MRFDECSGGLQCPHWHKFEWQKHGFGTRQRIPFPALTLRQVHSAEVWLTGGFGDREREGDALITGECNQPIAVRTADCVPILLLDRNTRTVAAVHAGWRGTAASIVSNAVEKLRATCGSDPSEIEAAVGPCIRACCYEVSEEVAQRFNATHLRRGLSDRPHLDLAEANKDQMIKAGLAPEHVYDCDLCTFCNAELFYSYRREPAEPGRMVSAICRIA